MLGRSTDNGVIIRDLLKVEDTTYSHGYTYIFQALIDEKWYTCIGSCDRWSFVLNQSFSVHVGWLELDKMHEAYIIQGLWVGGIICDEFSMAEELSAVLAAKGLLQSNTFEGDSVRVITSDGELVWESGDK